MEIIIIILECLILFGFWNIYKKIVSIGNDLDIELKGLNHKMVTLLILQGDKSQKK